jgi:deoxycytidine triphosphate deaminase
MSVIPLIRNQSVVTIQEDFNPVGNALLITRFDESQLLAGEPNLSYDLRVGSSYRDHREKGSFSLGEDGYITLLPRAAVIIRTEESVRLPRSMFGYIVPKVKMLEKGLSNTVSKVDAGYPGRLSVTLFNLGKKKVKVKRGEAFCSLVVHAVADGAVLYNKGEKDIGLATEPSLWRRFLDRIEAYEVLAKFLIIITYVGAALWALAKGFMYLWDLFH